MGDAGAGLGLPGGQRLRVQHLDDLGGQQCLGMPDLGVGIVEIAENIAAAANQLQIAVAHLNVSFSCLSRLAISSTSTLGVLMPLLDFFWKAWTTRTSRSICTTYTTR